MHVDLGLGKLIDTPQQKDAIHIAVAPVVATAMLHPSQEIGFVEQGKTEKVGPVPAGQGIGIVDPFYRSMIQPEQRFWMFLFPQTVTGMRHEWQHPAFEAALAVASPADRKAESLKWMEEFAKTHWSHGGDYDGWDGPYAGEQLIAYATRYLKTGDRHVQQGSESLRDDTPVFEFWKHFQVITGMAVSPDDMTNPFCCTC